MEKGFLEKIKIKNFNEIQRYKKLFENKKITEEEIPIEYRKEIRKIYIQRIQELRTIK